MQNKNIIIKKLIEYLSKTSIGEDIQYILEGKQEINKLSNTLLSHIIKFELATNGEPKRGWLITIKNKISDILLNEWFQNKNKTFKYDTLKYPLNNFNRIYSKTKENFNLKLSNNQVEFPDVCPEDKKNKIESKYKWIVDQIIDNNDNVNNEINDYFEIK
jgi:hypothetical protein